MHTYCIKPMNVNVVHCKFCLVLMPAPDDHACSVQNNISDVEKNDAIYKVQSFWYNLGLKNTNESHSFSNGKD